MINSNTAQENNQISKKYHIKTWGCQMNVYDSQRIGEIMQSLNYLETQELSEADVVILNTCHIREKATEKVYSDIGRLKVLKERRQEVGKSLIIGVSGCVAQAEGDLIIKRAPIVDLVFGPQTWHRLKDMLEKVNQNNKVCDTDFPTEQKFDELMSTPVARNRVQNGSAFIAIQEGCDKFCTYCVVPYTRGAEYSRPTWQVINEIDMLVKQGAKEITLLGQNVNAYHGLSHTNEEWSLGRLIRRIAEIEGLEMIRYVTSYPAEVDDDLIFAHRDVTKLTPFLHLPIQSGSDKILKAMNRRHNREFYLDLVKKLKRHRPDLALSSDFIVGFPGETDEDFNDTLDIIDKVGFIQAFSFIYSPRPGTPAALIKDQVDKDVAEKRLQILQAKLAEVQKNFNESCIGMEFNILLERQGKKEGELVGKSPYMQAVRIATTSPLALGSIVKVRVVDAHQHALSAKLV